jgi:hypothetical protein
MRNCGCNNVNKLGKYSLLKQLGYFRQNLTFGTTDVIVVCGSVTFAWVGVGSPTWLRG